VQVGQGGVGWCMCAGRAGRCGGGACVQVGQGGVEVGQGGVEAVHVCR
jgi:hypothetical protein